MRSASRSAFTLMEILVAMALVGLTLIALNTFVFSMGELWGKNADARLFDQHVRAVTRYLRHELNEAALPPAGTSNTAPIGVQQITPLGSPSGNLLTFMLLSGSRIISWPDQRLPEVVCSLQVRDGQGLFLLWHSDLEMHFTDDPPRESLISPYVTSLSYDYYDTNFNRWVTEGTVRTDNTGKPVTPQRLRLGFAYGHLKSESLVDIPTTPQGMPVP